MSVRPLYELAALNRLGDSQFMDKETIEWIASSPIANDPLLSIYLDDEDLLIVESLIPRNDYFLNKEVVDSIHGVRHILRVMVNTSLICKLLDVDSRNYIVAASIHDLRRLNDRKDQGHGARAWEWFEENKLKLPEHSNLISDIDVVKYSTIFHDTDYKDIPLPILERFKHDIDILKAGDALDRFRQPDSRWWPNMDHITLKEAVKLFSLSKRLTVDSERLALGGVASTQSVVITARELLT